MERINHSQEQEGTIKAANGKVSRSLNAAEIIADHNKMRYSAAGEDAIRLGFFRQAYDEVEKKYMWEESSTVAGIIESGTNSCPL